MSDITLLASTLGERHDGSAVAYQRLRAAADHIATSFSAEGWNVRRESFSGSGARRVENIEAERRGLRSPNEIIIVGAHYDSIRGGPGADDNATGVAALLALARGLRRGTQRSVRIVAFANEEHPHTRKPTMGSLVHARACRARGERVVAMISLESLGFHVRKKSGRRGDLTRLQRLIPLWTEGAFIVSNLRSRRLGDWLASSLRRSGSLPMRRVTAPGFLPLAKSSDHWSFWKNGYPAVMITDAAPLRYRHYHRATDSIDRIDGDALAEITDSVLQAVEAVANGRVTFSAGLMT